MNNFKTVPEHIELLTYEDEELTFLYPANGQIINFDRDNGQHVLRLLYPDDLERLRINIEEMRHPTSAEKEANNIYAVASKHFDEIDNVSPYQLSSNNGTVIWRTVKRFVDGGQAPLTIDTAFAQKEKTIYKLVFAVDPEHYAETRWVFDAVLHEFRLK